MKQIVKGVHQFQAETFEQERSLFEKLAQGQAPEALLITCSDSRIDPAWLTQTKPGDLFVQRTAGNIVPPYGAVWGGEAATIEYAVAALKVKDIVICGHSHCGAMHGLLEPEALKRLPAVRAYLEHAEATRRIVEDNHPDVTDPEARLMLAVQQNVLVQLENLRTHPTVAAALARDAIQLHGWVYKFESGEVLAFDQKSVQFSALGQEACPVHDPLKALTAV